MPQKLPIIPSVLSDACSELTEPCKVNVVSSANCVSLYIQVLNLRPTISGLSKISSAKISGPKKNKYRDIGSPCQHSCPTLKPSDK